MQAAASRDRERMLETYGPFILKTASGVLHRYIKKTDDAWSIALIAFWEAVDGYREDKGGFEAYAGLVIRRRLIDHQRRETRHAREISVAPAAFTGNTDGDTTRLPLQNQVNWQEARIREEIQEISRRLKHYGFSFNSLPDCSPKSEKTRRACCAASAFLLDNPALLSRMRRSRRLPVKHLALGAHVSKKLIERHRDYIIAVVEILDGGYPELSAYLTVVRKRVRP